MRTLMVFILLFSVGTLADDQICDSNASKSALVVIDMQPTFATRLGNDKTPENTAKLRQIEEAQLEAIQKAKANGIPIIFLEYVSSYVNFGDTNKSLTDPLQDYEKRQLFKKNSDGMFESENKSRAEIVAYLKKHKIGTLIITGANGGSCVKKSILGSLDGNCSVIAYSKGIADFNYEEFIYPYSGKYSFKPNCADCKFMEVSTIDGIIPALDQGPGPVAVPNLGSPSEMNKHLGDR